MSHQRRLAASVIIDWDEKQVLLTFPEPGRENVELHDGYDLDIDAQGRLQVCPVDNKLGGQIMDLVVRLAEVNTGDESGMLDSVECVESARSILRELGYPVNEPEAETVRHIHAPVPPPPPAPPTRTVREGSAF